MNRAYTITIGTLILLVVSVMGADYLRIAEYRAVLAQYPDYQLILLTNFSKNKIELLGRTIDPNIEFIRWKYENNVLSVYAGRDLVLKSEWRIFNGTTQVKYREIYPVEFEYSETEAYIVQKVDYFFDSYHTRYAGTLIRKLFIYPNLNKEAILFVSNYTNLRLQYKVYADNHADGVRIDLDYGGNSVLEYPDFTLNWTADKDKVSSAYKYGNGNIYINFKRGIYEIDPTLRIGSYVIIYQIAPEYVGGKPLGRKYEADLTHGNLPVAVMLNKNLNIKAQDVSKLLRKLNVKQHKITNFYIEMAFNETYNQNIWVSNITCVNVTTTNGTVTQCTDNGYWINRTDWRIVWKPLPDTIKLKANTWYYFNFHADWEPELGFIADDIIPTFKDYPMSDLAWWNTSWDKKRPITITTYQTETDYPMAFNISYDSDMQTDFDDLRFVDSDDSTELSYWIEEKVDGDWAYVWVKIPSLDNKTIYMYYDNPSATSKSNLSITMNLYEDVEEYSEGHYTSSVGSWTVDFGSVWVVDDGGDKVFYFNESSLIYYDPSSLNLSDYIATAYIKLGGVGGRYWGFVGRYEDTSNTFGKSYHMTTYDETDKYIHVRRWDDGSYTIIAEGSTTCNLDTYTKIEFRFNGSSITAKIYGCDEQTATDSTYDYGTIALHGHGAAPSYWNNITVRKIVDPEPTYTIGAEEMSSYLYYDNVGSNVTITWVGEAVEFFAYWRAVNSNLSYYIFSWNASGTWENDSAVAFGEVNESWSNITKTIPAVDFVSWRIWANNTDNKWNVTTIHNITVLLPYVNVTLQSPTKGSITSSSSVAFEFIPEAQNDLANATLYINESGWQGVATNQTELVNASTNSIDYTLSVDGWYVWNVKVCDETNTCNFSNVNWTLAIDTTPPYYDPLEVRPVDDDYYAITTINFKVIPFDNIAKTIKAELYTNETGTYALEETWYGSNGTAILESHTLPGEGTYGWYFVLYDNVSHTNQTPTRKVTIDQTPPVVYITSPENNSYLNYAPTISGTVDEQHPYETYTNDSAYSGTIQGSTSFSFSNTTALENRKYVIKVTHKDKALNEGSNVIVFTYDNITPTVSIAPPSPENESITGSLVKFNATANDTNLYYVYVTLDGIEYNMTNYTDYWYLELSVSEGTHYYNITAVDKAGNFNTTETRIFYTETEPPKFSNLNEDPAANPDYREYVFYNVTVTSGFKVVAVLFETNITGTAVNFTITLNADVAIYNASFILGPDNFTVGEVYYWRFWANNSAGWNATDVVVRIVRELEINIVYANGSSYNTNDTMPPVEFNITSTSGLFSTNYTTSTIPTFEITNIGDADLSIYMYLNETPPSCQEIYFNTSQSSTLIELNTTVLNVFNLTVGQSISMWLWTNLTNCPIYYKEFELVIELWEKE